MTNRERQSKFAYEVVFGGLSEKEAYLKTYDVPPGATEKQIATRASKVYRGAFVQSEIERFQKECQEHGVITKEELLRDIVEVYKVAKENAYVKTEDADGVVRNVLVPKVADVFAKLADRIALMIGANAPNKNVNSVTFEFGEELDKFAH